MIYAKDLIFEKETKEYTFKVYYQKLKNGFQHICEVSQGKDIIAKSKEVYSNRAWERFDGETALLSAIKQLPEFKQKHLIDVVINKKAEADLERLNNTVNALKEAYNKLTPKMKDRVNNDPPVIETESDIKRVTTVFKSLNKMSTLVK